MSVILVIGGSSGIGYELSNQLANNKLWHDKIFRFLIFKHQLFCDISLLGAADKVVPVEEFLFFNQ